VICRLGLVVLAVSLVSCGRVPQVPTDHYYRLTPRPETVDRMRLTEVPVVVEAFLAEGLYNDRAVLYSSDEHASELQQHHYYFWYTSPPRMLRDYLIQVLRNADVAPVILDTGAEEYPRISGKLLEFERRQSPAGSTAEVALELRVDGPGSPLPLLLRQYRSSETINDKDMTSVVSGFNSAVDRIYREFIGDLATALKAP
jgi:ABC-type uncharacterized transport system auxiliary subunit